MKVTPLKKGFSTGNCNHLEAQGQAIDTSLSELLKKNSQIVFIHYGNGLIWNQQCLLVSTTTYSNLLLSWRSKIKTPTP